MQIDIPSLPFKILRLAPFPSQRADPWTSGPLWVYSANLEPILEQVGVTVELPLARDDRPVGRLTLRFKRIKDFHPDGLLNNDPYLKDILDAGRFIHEATELSPGEIDSPLRARPDLPLQIRFNSVFGRESQAEVPLVRENNKSPEENRKCLFETI